MIYEPMLFMILMSTIWWANKHNSRTNMCILDVWQNRHHATPNLTYSHTQYNPTHHQFCKETKKLSRKLCLVHIVNIQRKVVGFYSACILAEISGAPSPVALLNNSTYIFQIIFATLLLHSSLKRISLSLFFILWTDIWNFMILTFSLILINHKVSPTDFECKCGWI